MAEHLKEVIENSLGPVKKVGKIIIDVSKEEVSRKITPTSPGGEKSLGKRILEKILKTG